MPTTPGHEGLLGMKKISIIFHGLHSQYRYQPTTISTTLNEGIPLEIAAFIPPVESRELGESMTKLFSRHKVLPTHFILVSPLICRLSAAFKSLLTCYLLCFLVDSWVLVADVTAFRNISWVLQVSIFGFLLIALKWLQLIVTCGK